MSSACKAFAVAALAAGALFATVPAHAIVVASNDTITVTGSLGTSDVAPFGSGDFTLSFTVPSQSFASGYSLSQAYDISEVGIGSYMTGGNSVAFTLGSLVVQGGDPYTTLFQVIGTIGSSDTSSSFLGTTNAPFFTATSETGGTQYDLTPGTYTISDFSAYNNIDPPITGGSATIGRQGIAVPEPATYALLAFPLVALGLLRRRRAA